MSWNGKDERKEHETVHQQHVQLLPRMNTPEKSLRMLCHDMDMFVLHGTRRRQALRALAWRRSGGDRHSGRLHGWKITHAHSSNPIHGK